MEDSVRLGSLVGIFPTWRFVALSFSSSDFDCRVTCGHVKVIPFRAQTPLIATVPLSDSRETTTTMISRIRRRRSAACNEQYA